MNLLYSLQCFQTKGAHDSQLYQVLWIFTFGFYLSLVWSFSKALGALPGTPSPYPLWLRGSRCSD